MRIEKNENISGFFDIDENEIRELTEEEILFIAMTGGAKGIPIDPGA